MSLYVIFICNLLNATTRSSKLKAEHRERTVGESPYLA